MWKNHLFNQKNDPWKLKGVKTNNEQSVMEYIKAQQDGAIALYQTNAKLKCSSTGRMLLTNQLLINNQEADEGSERSFNRINNNITLNIFKNQQEVNESNKTLVLQLGETLAKISSKEQSNFNQRVWEHKQMFLNDKRFNIEENLVKTKTAITTNPFFSDAFYKAFYNCNQL